MNKAIDINGQINTDYINRFNYIANSRLKSTSGFASVKDNKGHRTVESLNSKVELERLRHENTVLKEALRLLSK